MNEHSSTAGKFLQLDERVNNLGIRFSTMETNVARSFQAIEASIDGLSKELVTASQTSWSTIAAWASCGLVLVGMIGTLAYWPISTATNELKAAMIVMSENVVTRREYDHSFGQAQQDLTGIRAELRALTSTTIQQQRYNADKLQRDLEVNILRESIAKLITRDDFTAQHQDMKDRVSGAVARISRLEEAVMRK